MKHRYSQRRTVLAALLCMVTQVPARDLPVIHIMTRLDYYTEESEAALMFIRKGDAGAESLAVELNCGGSFARDTVIFNQDGIGFARIGLQDVPPGEQRICCRTAAGDTLSALLKKLPPRPNAVKIDRLRGGLIVDGLPFFPFGFYCYSPVQPDLAEQEAVNGFTMMSPYQKIEDDTRKQRRAYLDRCAALGMKVHYNLLSAAGGGGVGSGRVQGRTLEQKLRLLRDEVRAFKDHPALLAWYIADEPVGGNVRPEALTAIYRLIKELDPYHPVSIAFMAPARAAEYADVMDIVMADPYPVPHGSVTETGEAAALLKRTFALDKPVWIVPQAFGGGEHWEREPTAAELRVMTYLALIEGAGGIQYFIRHGSNGFPKSPDTWNAAGRAALETAELTPFLLTFERRPAIAADPETIRAAAWQLQGRTLVIAVNPDPDPAWFQLRMEGDFSGSVEVLFENRNVQAVEGTISDMIDGMGVRAYLVQPGQHRSGNSGRKNLLINGGFEDNTSVCIPRGCYARAGEDRGATYFTDSRRASAGHRSLRLVTPSAGKGVTLDFYPARLIPGQGYRLSLKAAGYDHAAGVPLDTDAGFFTRLFSGPKFESDSVMLELKLGFLEKEMFKLSRDWQELVIHVPALPGNESLRTGPSLSLKTRGTAWCDELALIADPLITTEIAGEERALAVTLSTVEEDAVIHYTLNGTRPGPDSPIYTEPLRIRSTPVIQAQVYRQGIPAGRSRKRILMHAAFGRRVRYNRDFSSVYTGGGRGALTDGETASADFHDTRWQAFEGGDLDVTIDFGRMVHAKKLRIGFLQDIRSWIFFPEKITVSLSLDKSGTDSAIELHNPVSAGTTGPLRRSFEADLAGKPFRYVTIQAVNRGTCPPGHPGAGGMAWLFSDEIIVE